MCDRIYMKGKSLVAGNDRIQYIVRLLVGYAPRYNAKPDGKSIGVNIDRQHRQIKTIIKAARNVLLSLPILGNRSISASASSTGNLRQAAKAKVTEPSYNGV